MKSHSHWRFMLEVASAVICAVLTAVTLIWKDWIEIVFGVEPDQGSGELEWLITGSFGLAAIVFALLAYLERRKLTPLLDASAE